jgi:signal transduction histidine kinase/ligand-binding sensor domain-containing protein
MSAFHYSKPGLMTLGSLLCLVVLILIKAPSRAADSAPGSNPRATNLHRWGAVTLFHGLPSDRVRAIAQAPDGAMWFGTDAGLARYDGRRIQTVSEEGLASRRILALRFDAQGTLWIGTDGGALVRLPSGEFRALNELTGKSVTALATTNAGESGRTILATVDGSIFECAGCDGRTLNLKPIAEWPARDVAATDGVQANPSAPRNATNLRDLATQEVTSVVVENGTVLVGTRRRGLLIVENGTLKELTTRPRPFFIETLAQSKSGSVLLGSQTSAAESGLFKLESSSNTPRLSKLAGATGTVTSLGFGSGTDLFAGTETRGVFLYRDNRLAERFTFAGTAGGLRSDRIYAVFVDREGVAWFGTDRGVCRYDPKGVSVEPLAEENDANFVRSIYRTKAGRLLVGTNRGLYVRDERAPTWRPIEEVAGKIVHAIAEDESGKLLVGTGAGLFIGLPTEPPAREEKSKPEETPSPTPQAAAEQAESTQTANDESQPPTAEEEKAEPPTKKTTDPALRGSVRAIAIFNGATYVASFGRGLERFDGVGRRTLIWPKSGEDQRGREVVSLYTDGTNERLWIGTANAGAFYFDGKTVKSDLALAALGDSTVWGVGSDGDLLWLATGRGLYARRAGGELLEIAPGTDARSVVAVPLTYTARSETLNSPQAWCATAGAGVLRVALDDQFGPLVARLDAEQGLPSQSAFALLPIAGDDRALTILVGTSKGLARYQPGFEPPALELTRVTASRTYQTEEWRNGPLTLEYPQSGLVVDYAANASRTFPEQFQYSFLLTDGEGNVIKKKVSHDSQFQAESLRAGRYRVAARAYTVDLTPSPPFIFEFEVARAPFPWTIVSLSVLLALALVALLWGYVQHRKIVLSGAELLEANRQLGAARLQLANEAESERRRIARDLHDQTLADLRRLLLLTDEMQATATSLNGENGSGASGVDPSELRTEIESISQEVRRICEDLSPSVLENVGFAAALEWSVTSGLAHLPADCRFNYDFLCDENLESRLRLSSGVQMQIYRIVQEAVSNICRHAEASNVRLSLHATDEGDFLLRLEDDGRGFNHNHKRERTGRGLGGIRARASLIEAEVDWETREGGGTVLVLRKKGAAV